MGLGEEVGEVVAAVVEEQGESVFWRCHFGGVWARTKETCRVMTEEDFLSGEKENKAFSNCINT